MCYCEEENLCLVIGCNDNAQQMVWDSTSCNDRGVKLKEFLNSSSLEIPNQGNHSTYCRDRRLEVVDITLGSNGFLERFTVGRFLLNPPHQITDIFRSC